MIYKTLRYLAQALAIYLIFKFLPTLTNSNIGNNLTDVDILMITAIIMLIYILFENLCGIYAEKQDCSTECARTCGINNNINKEHMAVVTTSTSSTSTTNTPSTPNTSPTVPTVPTIPVVPPLNQTQNMPDAKEKVFIVRNDADERNAYERQLEKKYQEIYELKKKLNIPSSTPQIERAGSRQDNGIVTNDMSYDTDYNHLPMANGYDSTDYEYGYSYLPPEKWYPTPPFPPICVQEKECPVCPMTSGPVDMKEWNESLRITPPDNINTRYIQKLNAGR